MTAPSEDELLEACVDSCRAMRRAFRGLVKRNVEAVCRQYKVEDAETVRRMVDETLKLLNSL